MPTLTFFLVIPTYFSCIAHNFTLLVENISMYIVFRFDISLSSLYHGNTKCLSVLWLGLPIEGSKLYYFTTLWLFVLLFCAYIKKIFYTFHILWKGLINWIFKGFQTHEFLYIIKKLHCFSLLRFNCKKQHQWTRRNGYIQNSWIVKKSCSTVKKTTLRQANKKWSNYKESCNE